VRLLELLVIAMVLWAWPAYAQSSPKAAAEAAYAEGQTRYAAGDYAAAAERFVAAHTLDPDPAYLYNAAQAFRFAKSCAEAADHYRRFIEAAPNVSNRAKVEAYIVEMEACTRPGDPARTDPPVEEARPQPREQVLPAPDPAPAEARDDNPGGTRRLVGIGVGVLGAIAVGVGVYYSLETVSLDDKTAKLYEAGVWTDREEALELQYKRDGDAAETRQIIAYSVGGAAIIGGIVLYALGRGAAEESPVSFVPTAGGGLAIGAFRF
jgi:tetratricopeptide (TPR) repeat protein